MDEQNVVDPYSRILFSYKQNGIVLQHGGNQDIMGSEMSQTQRQVPVVAFLPYFVLVAVTSY